MKTITAIIFVALLGIGALAADAKPKDVGMKKAQENAQSSVKGTIKSAELEKEHGRMIYSFDIRTKNGGTTEVNIDARTGKVIAVSKETAADEAKEKAQDKKDEH